MPAYPHGNEQTEYYSTSSRSTRQQQNLPSIRDIFGDVLEQPVARRVPSSFEVGTSRRQTYPASSTHEMRSFNSPRQLAHPIDHSAPSRSRSAHPGPSRATSPSTTLDEGSRAYDVPQRRSYEYTSKRVMRQEESSHSFDLFIASDQGLVHQRSSKRDNFTVSKEEAISLSTGKHVCPECGRRFEKRSHLKNHLMSHSGEKPWQCPWPGCGKAFSASSNLRRHERSHIPSDSSEQPTSNISSTS
ncbi:hypothetical protein JB92DRAFT_2841145 [Gautieria morchelliformis]|nr:hypothetical protein JB92DRAFT_2841145 [Gautieria morchelliformis]